MKRGIGEGRLEILLIDKQIPVDETAIDRIQDDLSVVLDNVMEEAASMVRVAMKEKGWRVTVRPFVEGW